MKTFENDSFFDNLPNEMVELIFSYIENPLRYAQVSKKFKLAVEKEKVLGLYFVRYSVKNFKWFGLKNPILGKLIIENRQYHRHLSFLDILDIAFKAEPLLVDLLIAQSKHFTVFSECELIGLSGAHVKLARYIMDNLIVDDSTEAHAIIASGYAELAIEYLNKLIKKNNESKILNFIDLIKRNSFSALKDVIKDIEISTYLKNHLRKEYTWIRENQDKDIKSEPTFFHDFLKKNPDLNRAKIPSIRFLKGILKEPRNDLTRFRAELIINDCRVLKKDITENLLNTKNNLNSHKPNHVLGLLQSSYSYVVMAIRPDEYLNLSEEDFVFFTKYFNGHKNKYHSHAMRRIIMMEFIYKSYTHSKTQCPGQLEEPSHPTHKLSLLIDREMRKVENQLDCSDEFCPNKPDIVKMAIVRALPKAITLIKDYSIRSIKTPKNSVEQPSVNRVTTQSFAKL